MSKFVSALLFLVLVGIALSSDPLASIRSKVVPHFQRRGMIEAKQSEQCSLPDSYPQECLTASEDFLDLITNAPSLEDINLDRLMDSLDVICTSRCIGPELEFYECLGQQDFADLFSRGYCGQSGGRNCFVLWIEGVNSQSVVGVSTCSLGGTCDQTCEDSLQTTVDTLGCCAASLYDNSVSPFAILITPQQFATCGVDLGDMCVGVSSAGITRIGLGLLASFLALAAIINAII